MQRRKKKTEERRQVNLSGQHSLIPVICLRVQGHFGITRGQPQPEKGERQESRKDIHRQRKREREEKERGSKYRRKGEKKSNGMAAGVAGETKDAGRN